MAAGLFAILNGYGMPLLNSLLKDKGASSLEAFTPEQPKVINADLDHSLRYFLIFIALGGAAAVWLSKMLLNFQSAPGLPAVVNVLLALVVLLLVMVFQSVMIQSTQFNIMLAAIEGLAVPAFFYAAFSPWFAVGTALFMVVWLVGFSRARALINNAMKVNFWHYSVVMITLSITGLAVLFSCLYLGVYQRNGGITFNAYKFIVDGATPGLQYITPNFNPETSVDSFLEGTIRTYLQKQEGFSQLPGDTQQVVIQETSANLLDRLQVTTSVGVKQDETIINYTFRWINDVINTLQQQGYGIVVVGSLFLIIFLSIKSIMFFVKWPVLFISFMIYLLLQAVGVISVGAEMRQKEVIVVK